MYEWYDIKVRCILGSGKRDVREMETVGRPLRWAEEGLEYEARAKHCQALREESKTVKSAVVKPVETGQEEDAHMLDYAERKKFRSMEAAVHYTSLDRSDVQCAAKDICTKMANPTGGSWKMLMKAANV